MPASLVAATSCSTVLALFMASVVSEALIRSPPMTPKYPDRLHRSHSAVLQFSSELHECNCIEPRSVISRSTVQSCNRHPLRSIAEGFLGMLSLASVRYWIIVDTTLAASSRGSLCGSPGGCLFCFRVGYSMHDLERAAEQIAIILERINDVCGHRKLRSTADQA